jgi:hypothetical protein
MANLFWKQHGKNTLNLVSTPFSSEEEFEKVVFETKELLEDIFLIKRQIRGGRKPGIPDIVGIDKNGNVCIVEMKNVVIDSSVIPQVLAYAIWAQNNPDSIKNLWRDASNQPDDISINWDNYEVRIIIIAPSIELSTLQLVNRITYPVDLIEIERWVEGSNHFLLVNKLEPEQPQKVRTTRGLETYDRAFYESHYNKQSVDAFLLFAQETEQLIKAKGLPLKLKFNKHYCSFKHGFFNAFGIMWISSKKFAYFFRLLKSIAEKIQPGGLKMDRYDDEWKQAVYTVDPSKSKVKTFLPLFEKAFSSVTGKAE